MSGDRDPRQRRWLSFGYGGKKAPKETWRYWPTKNRKEWVISTPHELVESMHNNKDVWYEGTKIASGATQWQAI